MRLAYVAEVPVNWCPELGTVLANEEVIDGKSEVGGFPVVRRPMRQWMLRITAFAERLIDELEALDWPEGIKLLQRNWIGRSEGAEIDFKIENGRTESDHAFSPRGPTRFTAPLTWCSRRSIRWSMRSQPHDKRAAVREISRAGRREIGSGAHRSGEGKDAASSPARFAINPVNDEKIPIWIADYVLMGYGTGAIMAVPAHDERDLEFARTLRSADSPVVLERRQSGGRIDRLMLSDGIAINSPADRRPADRGGERENHRAGSRNAASGKRDCELQAARLAFLASALLGRAVSDRLAGWKTRGVAGNRSAAGAAAAG